jgi:dGTPase
VRRNLTALSAYSAVVSTYAVADRERWVREDPAHKQADRDDFARDRARVLHSASLRRLSAKTQVVQPDSDDFVRNRLTHSLEVAQIGREFGAALGCDADVVDTACLAHDLGHPPFGHNGETALNDIAADIGGFEGNAQTLRLLTRLEAKRVHADGRPAGLNLTRASLDAVTKYPWGRDENRWGTVKFGVYGDDFEVFRWYRGSQPDGRRCLEAQTMDWSDDVAYSVHDVEDGVASKRLDLRALRSPSEMAPVIAMTRELYAPDLAEAELTEALARVLGTGWIPQSHHGSRTDLATLKDMTSLLIGRFVQTVGVATRARYGDGPLTRYAADLVIPDGVRAECAVLKGTAAHFVMFTDERRSLMGGQRTQIHELVDAYRAQPEARLDPLHRGDFLAAADDGAALRVIIDQVASLSDPRAKVLHQSWC